MLGTNRLVLMWIAAAAFGLFSPQKIAFGQPPAFDAASVKIHKGGGGTTREIGPGSLRYLNITLGELITMAYGGKTYQIAGPDWAVNNASSDRYDIIAKADGNVPPDQIRRMIGPLLAERFNLEFHRETREMPVYALTVLRGGPKFKEGDGGESNVGPDGKGGISFKNYPMDALVTLLSNMPAVGRSVVDRTGLGGKYTFTANLFETPSGIADVKAAVGADGDPVSSPVFSNVQLQLGLKLEAMKSPIDMIVIDHVEKTPTEN
ncbi:MAG TPA: TIGR03435 family protein [Terriglobia bacterium]